MCRLRHQTHLSSPDRHPRSAFARPAVCRDSTVVTRYTDVRTYLSQMLRQNCHPEVSCPMHIFSAIALRFKALPCAKDMITHMGFHAMPADRSEQGRDAQLVNPLKVRSLLAERPMTVGGAKSQVAGCSGRATRRSVCSGRRCDCPAGGRPGPAEAPVPGDAEVNYRVHGYWLAWTALCAPRSDRRPGHPAAAGHRNRPAAPPPWRRARARTCVLRPAPQRSRPVPGRNRVAVARGLETAGWAPVNLTRQYLPCDICFDFFEMWPPFGHRPCTCSAQFTCHSAVGVIK